MTIAHIAPRMAARPPYSVEVPDAKPVEGETAVRRHPQAVKELVARPDGTAISTIFELVKASVDKYGDAHALGSRRLLRTHLETRKVKKMIDGEEREVDKQWTYFELSGYEFVTYNQYWALILQIGSGLRALGLEREDRVHIFAATSANWLAMSHGAAAQSMPIVTAYDTLGEEGLRHSMVATRAKCIFLDPPPAAHPDQRAQASHRGQVRRVERPAPGPPGAPRQARRRLPPRQGPELRGPPEDGRGDRCRPRATPGRRPVLHHVHLGLDRHA